MSSRKNDILFWVGIVTALWFAFAGVFWILPLALVYAYPIGLFSLLCWYIIRHQGKMRTRAIPTILVIGLISSLLALVLIILNGREAEHKANKEANKVTEVAPVGDNSRVSLDWNGTYYGTLPCNDCDSINTTITLSLDNTYTKQDLFHKGKSAVDTLTESGKIEWSKDGNRLKLNTGAGYSEFGVGENSLLAVGHNVRSENETKKVQYLLNKIK
jgi:uncharacterized lipoprotein NlpE involved in copper resistance